MTTTFAKTRFPRVRIALPFVLLFGCLFVVVVVVVAAPFTCFCCSCCRCRFRCCCRCRWFRSQNLVEAAFIQTPPKLQNRFSIRWPRRWAPMGDKKKILNYYMTTIALTETSPAPLTPTAQFAAFRHLSFIFVFFDLHIICFIFFFFGLFVSHPSEEDCLPKLPLTFSDDV